MSNTDALTIANIPAGTILQSIRGGAGLAIHINDEEADWLLREFARKRKLKLTDALKAAIQEATRLEDQKVQEFQARVQPVIDRARIRKSEERARLATD